MSQHGYDPTESARTFASAWVRSSRHFSKGVTRLWQGSSDRAGESNGETAVEDGESESSVTPYTTGAKIDRQAAIEPSMLYETDQWTVERTADERSELGVGDVVRFSKRLTDDDVRAFAYASGDTNRLHLDDDFAATTRFGRRIAHGTLVSGTISAALARLPGMTIYLSQDLRFLKPVDIGDRVTAVCEIVEDLGDDRYRLTTAVEREDGKVVVDGEAVVLIDTLPDDD